MMMMITYKGDLTMLKLLMKYCGPNNIHKKNKVNTASRSILGIVIYIIVAIV